MILAEDVLRNKGLFVMMAMVVMVYACTMCGSYIRMSM